MKRLLAVLMLCGLVWPVQAQEEVLYGMERRHGGFAGVVAQRSTLVGAEAWLVGFRAGWVYNARPRHTLIIGAGAYGVTTDVEPGASAAGRLGLDYGGLELEYVYATRARVHPSASVLLGAGNAAYEGGDGPADDLVVVEPGLHLEARITPFWRVSAGVGYRLVHGVRLDGVRAGDLSGTTGVVTCKLGRF